MSEYKDRALFIDRDGILNELVDYDGMLCAPRNESDLVLYPNIDQFKKARAFGYRLILVTNQPDIERGWMKRQWVDSVLERYEKQLELDAVYMCPHKDNAHPDKKPNPGMLLRAQEKFELNLSHSYFLGDTDKDVMAAKRAGCQSVVWSRSYNAELDSDYRIASFDELWKILDSSNE